MRLQCSERTAEMSRGSSCGIVVDFEMVSRVETYDVVRTTTPSTPSELVGSRTRPSAEMMVSLAGGRGSRSMCLRLRLIIDFLVLGGGGRSDLEGWGTERMAVRELQPQPVEAGREVGELEAAVLVGRAVEGALLAVDLAQLHGSAHGRDEPAVQPCPALVVGGRDPDQQLHVVRAEAQGVGLRASSRPHQLAETLDHQHQLELQVRVVA